MAVARLSFLLALSLLVVAVAAKKFEHVEGYEWEEYIRDFGKQFSSASDAAYHKGIFLRNIERIIKHNKSPRESWKMGVNKFTDMTQQEIQGHFGWSHKVARNLRKSGLFRPAPASLFDGIRVEDLPTAIDWRTKNVVSPVKDQMQCGSCWAFASAESIESAVAQATGNLPILSPQNLVDCVPNPDHCGGTGGCEGATAELAFAYVMSGGIASEDDYPYTGSDGDCDETIPKTSHITNFVKLPENNYTALLTAVATVGPISVSVDASPWIFYSSGVFTGCAKPGEDVDINHAVQLVGYGTDSRGGDYWIVRNSWSEDWGENGYIRIQKHSDGSSKWCNTDHEPGDGSGCAGGPSTITVCGSCGIWYDSCYPTGASVGSL